MATIKPSELTEIFNRSEQLYQIIMHFFWDWEEDHETKYDLNTITQYIKALKENLKKLCDSKFFNHSRVQRWIEDSYAFEEQADRIRYEKMLCDAAPWIIRTYNSYNKLKGNELQKITNDDVRKLINILLNNKNLVEQRNKIRAIARRNMSEPALVRFINAQLYNSNFGESVKTVQAGHRLNEDFYNPFDDDDELDVSAGEDSSILGKSIKTATTKKNAFVKSVRLWNSNRKEKIELKDNRMFATNVFVADDIVEECPVYLLGTQDLYSPRIRDIAFEIDPENRLYGIPMGFANYYRTTDDVRKPGNIDYTYDPKEGIIRFYAIRKIHKGDELILKVDSPDISNTVKNYQFKY